MGRVYLRKDMNSLKYLSKRVEQSVEDLANTLVLKSDTLSNKRIKSADFDRTLYGIVTDKTIKNNAIQWTVSADGVNYLVSDNSCNITSVGQQVRLFIPNHNYAQKYAEVIFPANHPAKAVYDSSEQTITEYWDLEDGTQLIKVFRLTVVTDGGVEEVTKITMPDGTSMDLEGFVVG